MVEDVEYGGEVVGRVLVLGGGRGVLAFVAAERKPRQSLVPLRPAGTWANKERAVAAILRRVGIIE